ncbi:NAD-dependent succinate-semialdehyde dehydrogenase [Ancylobacter defluvii]|uniref:NAD-dependent succinate-semialdehyde dehydrogenase n=1 Tax=Ancylobacter defluvii TaxID=1282440 RepID=A0A9W6JVN0_9HYPH|nr:NAD-dependent succinate-semialdehyde dehydrogenase [Ancylobacter defluvii]MBS7590467.1 NAD-dependent succinate-semialdehyde dehydrogenase [Ancylobacter defluvii]GLK83388.1 NAD-dependent succinate-semialdehyde dehydrogenase [Ancylobacter defluvii]
MTSSAKNPFLREAVLIDGAWVGADSGATIAVTDPATGDTLGTIPDVGAAETGRAIAAADAAFPGWSSLLAAERAEKLLTMANHIRANADALAALLTSEQGKPLKEAKGEVMIAAAYVQWFAEEARRVYGEVISSPWKGRKILVTREPVGVVGAITPWNFPFSMIARKLGAALAAGCTIVVKPSEFTPYCGLAWGVLAEMAGIPNGVVNVLTGDAKAIGGALTSSPLVKKITFTGSTRVGKILIEQSAATVKRLSMELGGNAPFIVFDDADLDRAVEGALAAKYRNSGQTCVCTNRFFVQAGIYDAFAEKLAARAAAMKVGNGFDDGVEQGPLINAAAVEKVERHVADALGKGARLLTGGARHALGGTFFAPTVIADVKPGMLVMTDETFGPLSALVRFETEAEAIASANATEFGLAAYLYTKDLARAFRVTDALQFGMVGVNEGIITTEVAPFGGVKESGMGREGSLHGLDDYLNMKYISLGGL